MRRGHTHMKPANDDASLIFSSEETGNPPVSREVMLIALVLATAVIIVMVSAARALAGAGWLNVL